MKPVNVLMVGVGGQGVIIASDILAEVAMGNGYDVKKSDSIGMAQRGGSVVSHIRLGERVFSPLIKMGEADFLIGFEELETARWANYLKKGGVAILADVVLVPLTVIGRDIPYPSWDIIESIIRECTEQIYLLPAVSICRELSNLRALNMVLLGFLSAFMEIDYETWQENIKGRIPSRFVGSSLVAFSRGAAEAKIIMRGAKEVKNDA